MNWYKKAQAYTEIGHHSKGIAWWYEDGKIKTMPPGHEHESLKMWSGRFDPITNALTIVSEKASFGKVPSSLLSKLYDKFGFDIKIKYFDSLLYPSPFREEK
ncbi:MAG: hypothetical protein ACOCWG_00985 [bacterium]